MKRKWLAVGIILLFVGIAYAPAIAQNTEKPLQILRGNWLYVGGSGPGNYTKIQDAIDNASDGDIVFVYNGIYFENIRINKLIYLIGCDRNTTILDGYQNSFTIITLVKGVTIKNFTIQNSRGNGVVVSSNYTKIVGNIIKDCDGAGIWINFTCNRGYNNISENMIMNNYVGVYLSYSDWNNITNNIISFNKNGGILMGSDYSTIVKNKIFNNTGLGIRLKGGRNTINTNIIKDNTGGIRIEHAYENKIIENNFQNNNIELYLSGTNLITKNNFFQSSASFSYAGQSKNIWRGNYWNESRFLPKPIMGRMGYTFDHGQQYLPLWSWVNFDWFPAKEPYEIQGMS